MLPTTQDPEPIQEDQPEQISEFIALQSMIGNLRAARRLADHIARHLIATAHQEPGGSFPDAVRERIYFYGRIAGDAEAVRNWIDYPTWERCRLDSYLIPNPFPPLEATCEVCGCTQSDGCPGGCAWVRRNLCTACAPADISYPEFPDPFASEDDAAGDPQSDPLVQERHMVSILRQELQDANLRANDARAEVYTLRKDLDMSRATVQDLQSKLSVLKGEVE